jgi:hypothetical protein
MCAHVLHEHSILNFTPKFWRKVTQSSGGQSCPTLSAFTHTENTGEMRKLPVESESFGAIAGRISGTIEVSPRCANSRGRGHQTLGGPAT